MVDEIEGLVTEVILPNQDDSAQLTIVYGDDVLTFKIDGKTIFSGDWTGNFKEVFEKALKKWKEA